MVTNRINLWTLKFNDYFKVNLNILITLCIVSQHSFVIKFLGIFVLAFLNFNSIKRFDYRKIPKFYILIASIEVLKFFFHKPNFSIAHLAQFMVGITYWIAAILLCWVIYDTIIKQKNNKQSLYLFTILNFAFNVFQFVKICLIEHTINPFNTGHNHPYGISTGDLLNGLFHGVHLTNAFVSLFLILFYLHERKYHFVFLSLIPLLLTGNNYATIVLSICLALYFFINKNLINRAYIALCIITTVLFYVFVTPFNAEYLIQKVLHISATLPNTARDFDKENSENKDGYKEVNIADTLNPYDIEGKTSKKIKIKMSSDSIFDFVKQSGKVRSYHQTKEYLFSSVSTFLFGSGMGGFSSKLAFNSSGVMEGSTLNKLLPKYEKPEFVKNHKALYAYLKTLHVMFHSESNRPFSVYNQLLGEYGLVGFLLFIIAYLLFFFKRIRKNSYALPVFIALLFLINIDYFFESLSLMLFFETLMFMDAKENTSEHAD